VCVMYRVVAGDHVAYEGTDEPEANTVFDQFVALTGPGVGVAFQGKVVTMTRDGRVVRQSDAATKGGV
jgi:hypothetical protein